MGAQCLIRLLFDCRPGGTELLMLGQNHAEHLDRLRRLRHRETHTLARRDIEVVEEPVFIDLPSDDGPGFLLKGITGVTGDGGRTGKAVEQPCEPLRA
jgi:hypothetical protein